MAHDCAPLWPAGWVQQSTHARAQVDKLFCSRNAAVSCHASALQTERACVHVRVCSQQKMVAHGASSDEVQDVSDMKAINKEDGKVPHPLAGQLLLPDKAPFWPHMALSTKSAEKALNPAALPEGIRARVILARYRQSAEAYLEGWRNCVVKAFGGTTDHVDILELNIVDLTVRRFSRATCRHRSMLCISNCVECFARCM